MVNAMRIVSKLVYTTRLDKAERYWHRVGGVGEQQKPKNNGWIARRHYLPPSPKGYEWTVGEPVVMVQWTAAGWMATGLQGLLEGLEQRNGRRMAKVEWSNGGRISAIVPLQRIRPLWLVKG